MNRFAYAALAALLCAAAPAGYSIDQSHYFSSPAAEAASRATAVAAAHAFTRSATPRTAAALYEFLQRYDALLTGLERHDLYVYLRAEEDDRDVADADADDALGNAEDALYDRIVRAAKDLGAGNVASFTRTAPLRSFRYLLVTALDASKHRLSASDARAVATAVTPVLDASATTYEALRKSPDSIESRQDAYAALLVAIVSANNGIARLRGFAGAPEASYSTSRLAASVERALSAVRTSHAYARYRQVANAAPKPAFSPTPIAPSDAILDSSGGTSDGRTDAVQYGALCRRRMGVGDLHGTHCDRTGFSLGFSHVTLAVYFGNYDGSVNGRGWLRTSRATPCIGSS